MRIFVTGATGLLGRRAVARLVEAGHDVTGVARTDTKADQVRAVGATPAVVDLFDGNALRTAVAGHEVICHLATHVPPMSKAARRSAWEEHDRLRRDASRLLVDAALAGDVERYVGESLAFTYLDGGSRWLDEDSELDRTVISQTTADAEAAAARMTEAGRTGVALRFGQFYGSDSAYSTFMVKAARRRLAPTVGAPDAYLATIHLDDAAASVLAALDAPAGVYNVTDDEPLQRREWDDTLAAVLGVGHLRSAGRLLARLAPQRMSLLSRSERVSNRRFKLATGWAPTFPSAREGWPAVVAEIDQVHEVARHA